MVKHNAKNIQKSNWRQSRFRKECSYTFQSMTFAVNCLSNIEAKSCDSLMPNDGTRRHRVVGQRCRLKEGLVNKIEINMYKYCLKT